MASFYEDHILPRCIDFALSRAPILEARRRIVRGLSGVVLEIGFGSGLNVPYYPAEVTKVLAVDPSALGRKLAEKRVAKSSVEIEWCGLDGESLELPDASVDAVLSTFTLCTIPNVETALGELRRVLKPNGVFHFLEHGRSPDAGVARWQDRLNPFQRYVAGGCNLNRPMADLVRNAGFCLDALDNRYLPGPKPATYIYEARARNCGC